MFESWASATRGRGFGPDELLLQLGDLSAGRLFVLELGDLVGNLFTVVRQQPLLTAGLNILDTYLRLVVARRLHAALRIPNLLQHATILLKPLRKVVLLLRDFS